MHLKKILSGLSLFLSFLSPLGALEVVEDDLHIQTTRTWGEFTIENQRLLLQYFDGELTQKLKKLGIPTFWNRKAEKTLLGDQERFNSILNDTHAQAKNYATNQNISIADLLPSGFFMGFGVTGSANFIAGMGASALLTLIVVPLEIEIYDKITKETTKTYEASWAIGGIGGGSVGAGVGGGIAVRGALGLIWGHLPNANQFHGTAVGIGGSIAAISGLGFKAAVIFSDNDSTSVHAQNLIAMATYDIGATAHASISAEVFYFLDADQVSHFISAMPFVSATGISIIHPSTLKLK